MNENLLKRIKRQLNAKFYTMNDAWLRDCVKYFIRDANHEITDRHILEFVESQWQLSDLREINNENGCLPKNLIQQVHTLLTDTYILQVDKMYDIANSKYKQLCEIRKSVNSENLEVTEEEKQTEWEPKARKMIQLCLTDGMQDVTAIEYTPLKQMTNMLLPGYKVMIIGPVSCRRGVILLEDGKYKEIGGEVESLLKPNALENVLARALGELENSDPYNDNLLSKAMNQNIQNDDSRQSGSKDSLFNDDFEEIVDLEAVTAIERQNQEIGIIPDCSRNVHNQKQVNRQTKEIMEDLENIDFEPLENWPNESFTRSAVSASDKDRMEIEQFNNQDDIIIIEEETSNSTYESRNKLPLSASVFKDKYASEFSNNDFDFDDYEIVIDAEKSRSQQAKSLPKNETKAHPSSLMPKSKLPTPGISREVERNISKEGLTKQNKKSATSASSATANIETISNVLKVSSEPIAGRIHKIVKAHVKSHSALKKESKHWAVTALIADHTSSIEVCFESDVLERFLGFTVQEFVQKKKLAKLDSQVNNELRQNLRKAQYQIQNLHALLKLELTQDKIPKIVDIVEQKGDMKNN